MDIRIAISSGHDWGDRGGLGGQASNPDRGRFFLHSRLTPLLSVQFHRGPFAVPHSGSLVLEGGHPIVRETAGSKLSEFA
jgi:hypothetical protein